MKVYFLFLLRCRKLGSKESEMANAEKLTDHLCQLLQMFGMEVNSDVRNEFIDLLNYVRESGEREIQTFYRTMFISKVCSCMPSTFEISLKETLETLENPLIRIIANFVENGDVPTLHDIKRIGKEALSCLVIDTVGDMVGLREETKSLLQVTCNYMLDVAEKTGFSNGDIIEIVSHGIAQYLSPNAPENMKHKIGQILQQGSEILFGNAEKKPSMESFFTSLWELSGERFFVDGFKAKLDEILGEMPLLTDKLNVLLTKQLRCLLTNFCRDRERDVLLSFICLSIENIVKKGTLRGRKFIGQGIELLYQSLRTVLDEQNIDGINKLVEFIYELLKMFFNEMKEEVKKELIALFENLRGLAANELSNFYKKVIIPKLSKYIKAGSGIPVEKLLKAIEKPITSILENFVKKCEVPTIHDIKTIGKQALSSLVVDTVGDLFGLREEIKSWLEEICNYMLDVAEETGISKGDIIEIVSHGIAQYLSPNAPENMKHKIGQILQQGSEILFGNAEKKPSMESFFTSLWELSGERFFVDGFKSKVDEILGEMPLLTDKLNVFLTKQLRCLLTNFCRDRERDILLPLLCSSIENIVKKGTLQGREFIGQGIELLYQSLRRALEKQNMDDISKLGECIYELLKTFCNEMKEEVKKELIALFDNLRGIASNELINFYKTVMIPKLSQYIKAASGIPVERLLKAIEKPVTSLLENFVKKCEIPTLDNIKGIGKESLICLVVDIVGDWVQLGEEKKSWLQEICNHMLDVAEKTSISKGDTVKILSSVIAELLLRNAPDSLRDKIAQLLQQGIEVLFGNTKKKPSMESFFSSLWELSGGRFFRDVFKAKAEEIIKKMPYYADKVGEFVMKHVMPLLVVHCNESFIDFIKFFAKLVIEIIVKKGTIQGRDFIIPGGRYIFHLFAGCKEVKSAATRTAVKTFRKEVTETVTEKLSEKVVVKKTGEIVTAEVSKEVTVSASKRMAIELTEHTTSQVAQGAGKTAKDVIRCSKEVFITTSKEVTIESTVKVVGDVTTVTAEKTTLNVFEKTTKQKIVQETTENVAKAGAKTALKECCKAAAISAVVGGVFLYKDLSELEKDYKEGRITTEEYQKQRAGRYGEFAGDVIGSGFTGAVIAAAALSGPAGWMMIGAGALVSYGFGCAGRQIASSVS